jgi:hypothetical protein
MRRMPSNPVPALRSRLLRFQGRYPEIIRRSGISRSWISKFANGKLGKRTGFELMGRLVSVLDTMERQAVRKVGGRKRVHANTVRGRKTLANARNVGKTKKGKTRG